MDCYPGGLNVENYTDNHLHSAPDQRTVSLQLDSAHWSGIASALRLSPRELEVVRGVFEYGCDPAIAVRLGISPHTVHTHLDRIYRKINVGNRCDLVLKVFASYLMLQQNTAPPMQPDSVS